MLHLFIYLFITPKQHNILQKNKSIKHTNMKHTQIALIKSW